MAKSVGRGGARAAKAAAQTDGKPPDTIQIIGTVISLIGCLPFVGLALVFLIVIAVVASNASFGASTSADPSAGASAGPGVAGQGDTGSIALVLAGGDGKGEFAADKITRQDLVAPLEQAGTQCDTISPVVLAAQIQEESGFNNDATGPNGETGISQLPPAIFDKYGKDDNNNGTTSALDPVDSIYAQARYLCDLAGQAQQLLDAGKVKGDLLTLTLLAWDIGMPAVEKQGGMPFPDVVSYPYQVRLLFSRFETGAAAATASDVLTEAQFDKIFPGRSSFYTYAGLTAAMAKYPAFGGTGNDTVRKQEVAAFLGNVNQESGGLLYVEELNQTVWGNYCDNSASYGCPAGRTAYHGRGPLQLTWNTNYYAAGQALGLDLLNNPDLVKNDPAVAWQTALWFWMTQNGAGTMTAHAAMTNGAGFGETIRSINGVLECNGGQAEAVNNRIESYKRYAAVLGVDPGDKLTC